VLQTLHCYQLFHEYYRYIWLAHTSEAHGAVYPYVHQYSNVVEAADQLRPVKFPDVDPTSLPSPTAGALPLMSMAAGEFVEVYSSAEHRCTFDAVATVFMIDTARNVVEYITTIFHVR
jgi:carnosine N-methyltransferase